MANLEKLYFYLDNGGILNLVYEDIYAELDTHLILNGDTTNKVIYDSDEIEYASVDLVSELYSLIEKLEGRG